MIGSAGERKELIGDWLGEGRPAIDLPHPDLARREQRPKEHGGGICRGQNRLGLDPAPELLVKAFNSVGNRYDDFRCQRSAGIRVIPAYGATIRDGGTGSTKVRAGRSCTMSRELVLVAGRLCDSPGCAVSDSVAWITAA